MISPATAIDLGVDFVKVNVEIINLFKTSGPTSEALEHLLEQELTERELLLIGFGLGMQVGIQRSLNSIREAYDAELAINGLMTLPEDQLEAALEGALKNVVQNWCERCSSQ